MTKPPATEEPSAVGIRVKYKDELTHPMWLKLCSSPEGRISLLLDGTEVFMANLVVVPWTQSRNHCPIPAIPLSRLKGGAWRHPEEVAEIHVVLDNREKWLVRTG